MATQVERPNRKDYYVTVVLAPNGQIVDHDEWTKVLSGKEGKDRRAAIREHGWKETKTFNTEAYEKAVKEFREHAKTATAANRKELFDRVFSNAGVKPHPRLEAALRTLIPAMETDNEQRFEKALENVCIAVEGMLKEAPQRGGRKARQDGNQQAAA